MAENTDADLEDLKEQTQVGNSIQETDEATTFTDEIVGALDDVEAGNASNTLSMYDPKLAALVHALERDGDRLDELVSNLEDERGREIEKDRSEILREILRAGIDSVDDELLSEAREAHSQRAADQF